MTTHSADPTLGWSIEASRFEQSPADLVTDLAWLDVLLVWLGALLALLRAIGWAAGAWVITEQALGASVGVGAALRHGARRSVGLWGWTLLSSLPIGLGVLSRVLPGICLAAALSLVGPVRLFARREALSRSSGFFHARLGLLLWLPAGIASLVGLVLARTEQRGHEAPVHTVTLAAELG